MLRKMSEVLLHASWMVGGGAFALAGEAFAGWGDQSWGTMIWGASPVPLLGIFGLMALAISLAVSSGWALRRKSTRVALVLVMAAVPLGVAASTLSAPHVFVNGTIADASEVNENFSAVETAVNDNDTRITALEGSECVTVESGSFARDMTAQCPGGTLVTGGGCSAQNTGMWISTSRPLLSDRWQCIAGGGPGNVGAYARCCDQ